MHKKIKKKMKVCVVGLGWMGLPIAALFSEGGNDVVGLTLHQESADEVNSLKIRRKEQGLIEILKKRPIKATIDPKEALSDADAIVIIVPLIVNENKSMDFRAVDDVMRKTAKHMKENALVIMQTTMPIGACRKRLLPVLEKSGKKFYFAYSPIRAMSGTAIRDMRDRYPRVLGAIDNASMKKAEMLLKTFFRNKILKMPLEEAEATKIYEVIYRDTNIALANELGLVSEELGLDYFRIKEAANSCGHYHLHDAGIGVGGHCLPVYPYLLLNKVKKSRGLVRRAREINDSMPAHAVGILKRFKPKTVTIFGVSYLKDTNETRFSPSIELSRLLKKGGMKVMACDPNMDRKELSKWGTPCSIAEGLKSDALVFTVDHSAFKNIEERIPKRAVVVDGRAFLNPKKVKGTCITIGRG